MLSACLNEKKITNETTHTQKDTKNAQSFCLSGSPKGRGQRPPISFQIMTPTWFSPTPPRHKRSEVLLSRMSPRPDFACYISPFTCILWREKGGPQRVNVSRLKVDYFILFFFSLPHSLFAFSFSLLFIFCFLSDFFLNITVYYGVPE